MFHRRFCNGAPFSKHLFSDGGSQYRRRIVHYSCTTNLVVSAPSLKNGLCGRYNSLLASVVIGALSTIPFAI